MSDIALIEDLGVPHRARAAYRQLLEIGPRVLPAVRKALHHSNAEVRFYCARYLDRFLEPAALGELIAMLDDPDPKVRSASLHALACDRCKQGACHPDEAQVLPVALRVLNTDPDAFVRAIAIEVIGLSVHTRPEAVEALQAAIREDASPTVRKKAGWFAPGGAIYRRTTPKPVRKPR